MNRSLLAIFFISVLIISCGTQNVIIQYQGSSPIPRVSSERDSAETNNDTGSSQTTEFVTVSSIPILKGGDRALQKKIEYPEKAIQNNIEGIVKIQFIIDEEGETSNFTVVEGIGYGCEESVIHAIQESQFVPGSTTHEAAARHLWMVTAEFKL